MVRFIAIFVAGIAALNAIVATPVVAQEHFAEGDFADYSPDIENGEQVLNAAGCAACHSVDGDDRVLAGGMDFFIGRFGTLYAPNISPHPRHGIGAWSRADFLNAVLRGVSPNGNRYLAAVFPFPAYARMSPEDALDMRAYLATLPQADTPSRDHSVNYLGDALLRLFSSERPALDRPADPQLARGEYLVEALGHCADCHTPRTGHLSERLDFDRPFEGQTTITGEYAGAIGPDRLGLFSAEAFVNGAMADGLRLDGLPMASTIMRRISRATAELAHEDRVAMYAYLVGQPVDPDSVARPEGGKPQTDRETVDTADAAPQKAPRDETGATALMSRIDAYCAAPEESLTPVAAAAGSEGAAEVDPALEAAADSVIERHCRSCHGPGMTYQRSFLTGSMAQLARDPSAVRPGDHEASRLYETIASNRMPTPEKPRLEREELQAIVDWIDALAPAEATATDSLAADVSKADKARPELPKFVGGMFESIVSAAVSDLGDIAERDRPFIRYFSFAHLPLPEVDCSREGALRNPMHYFHAGLNKFINSVSRASPLQRVAPVPGTDGALVRIDIRDFGWTVNDWRAMTEGLHTQGAVEAGYTPQVWADLVPTYRNAVAPQSDAMLEVLSNFTGARVPVMQADWFARHASESPLYDVLLRLPANIEDLERRMGIDVHQEIRAMRLIRAGFLADSSGVSDHNRMLERFDLPRGGYYWRSYDFAGSEGMQSLVLHPDGPAEMGTTVSGTSAFEHDGGEMIFSLPNGMQGYYLSEANGRRLAEGPTSIVSFRERPIGRGIEIVNARSCFSCHENGIISKTDELRQFIQTTPGFDREQRETLMRMYPEQDVLDEHYRRDIRSFLAALTDLNATRQTVAGRPTSLQAPDGSGEIVTWLADFRFARLDEANVARRFFLDVETFRARARQIADPGVAQLVSGWLQRFDKGLMVTLDEYETHYAAVLPRLTKLDAVHREGAAETAARMTAAGDYSEAAIKAAESYAVSATTGEQANQRRSDLSAYTPPAQPADPLQLKLHVPNQKVQVNDLLTFEVEANRACTLQIVYVEINDDIVELPQSVIGASPLEPGERRLIPQPGSGLQLRFDRPGVGETLLAYCREPSSAQPRLDAEEMLAVARRSYQPLLRGLKVEAAKRTKGDAGRSAFASVTIDVLKP